jgi:hypothetical protein
MSLAREGLLPINKIVTIFATLLQVGVGFTQALIIQGVVMLAVAAAVFYVWQLRISLARQAATLVLGTFLFTPYAFSYDLALLALPLAWLGWEGYNNGWRPGEPAFLCLGCLLLFITSLMALIKCQMTSVILAALLIFVVKRSKAGASSAPEPIIKIGLASRPPMRGLERDGGRPARRQLKSPVRADRAFFLSRFVVEWKHGRLL